MTPAFMAVERSMYIAGTMNESATKNLERNVTSVASQFSVIDVRLSNSLDICIPSESDSASAIAIVKMPPITANLDWVPALSPTSRPSVVMTPDVIPKPSPDLNEYRMFFSLCYFLCVI